MSSQDVPQGAVLAVVHEPVALSPGGPLVLELRGPLGPADAETVAARLAQRHRAFGVALDSHRPGHHTLRLTPPAAGGVAALPADLLADLLAPPPPGGEVLPVTGHQQTLLRAALTPAGTSTSTSTSDSTSTGGGSTGGGSSDGGGAGGGVEQLYWDWSGPLDVARFAAAWQSVVDRECVLRACFEWVAAPRLVLHARAGADIAVCSPAAVTWPQLLRRDRARGFALHRPGLLRLTLLEAEPGGGAGAAPPRVLLTYHPALLDERGVHLLLREFYRAYAGGGVLPGGERRPDLRDHARWLAGQDTTAARQFWARAVPPPRAATRPVQVVGVGLVDVPPVVVRLLQRLRERGDLDRPV
ncbi:hypothetical protein ABZW44_49680, partial [Streptomyces mirabilis]